ncbi:glycoside hydrolase family 31 protein [Leeuwenhoekiella nanhaiensis]|uniref:Alpha-glycosidase n=1 Tax=Leeuwenhoekiella nanhaiensis TaxID=1655491 RepID=A0A2G1VMV7_9FLAO|nr:TIM-barrel domain-containing protein [Leeuwenhoekiella nanhaiensis]PHQ28107.1 alpha-glycosidase [Leeuwenhoekiella nanhaiensis]
MRFPAVIILFVFAFSSQAQTGLGNFQEIENQNENYIQIKTDNAHLRIEICSDDLLRIRNSWEGNFEADEPYMVVKYDWPATSYTLTDAEKQLTLETEKLKIEITKQPVRIQVFDLEGKLLNADASAGNYRNHEHVGVQKQLFPDEHFFGLGERMDFLDRRGKKTTLTVGRGEGLPHIIGAYNVLEANYSPVPFIMSTRGYGIFFHTPFTSTWDLGHSTSETYSFEAEGGELDYYFIYGPDFEAILDRYTRITGKAPLLPKAALGLHVGTYSGGTWGHEEKTSDHYPVDLVRKFRELHIPIDILHLDSTWRIFGKNGGSGATTFEWRETFENPEAMFDSLYAEGLSMVGVHVRPRFDNGNTLNLLDQAREAGFVYPEPKNTGEFVNFFDTKAVDWWWQNGAKRLADTGAMFFKTDEGSAFGRKANESNKTGPQGPEIKRLHNLFPLAYAKAPYEKFQEYNSMRGMNHTREGYAGIQRYPFIFAGDWPSEWQYFEPVIKAGLNIGLSGVSNWAHCMGGFEHVADPELYIRWTQFGLLSPIAHLFGMEHPNYKEPWAYGEEALANFKKYDELRYELAPYLYSAMYENHLTGKPMMRALVLDYQNDPNVYDITDQYLLGNDMMICPVVTKGAQTRTVYLPQGNWINYWTGNKHAGSQYLNVLCPLDQIPIFIKEGAIIPTQKLVQTLDAKTPQQIILDIYPGTANAFTLYDDDGKSLGYQNGKFTTTRFELKMENDQIHLNRTETHKAFDLNDRSYTYQIHLDQKPGRLWLNEEEIDLKNTSQKGISYNPKDKVMLIHTGAKQTIKKIRIKP